MKTPPPRKAQAVPKRVEDEIEVPNGMRLHKVGNIVRNGGKIYRCIKVSASNATFQNVKNAADIKHFSNCHDRSLEILSSSDDEKADNTNQNETHMAKKTNTEKKTGKIEFIESLLDGKLTKAEIAAKVVKQFGVPEKTAKNTVNWTCSTWGTRNKGEAKFKEVERAAKTKPAKKSGTKKSSKKPAARKSPPQRKPAPAASAPAEPVAGA